MIPIPRLRLARQILLVTSVAAASPGVYTLVLTLAGIGARAPRPASRSRNFLVVVPAHNESENIALTLASLANVNTKTHKVCVIVVADNCTDDTAGVAARSGAKVVLRASDRRGKGHALSWFFEQWIDDETLDAFVVIDADTIVSSNLLDVLAAHLDAGALAVQADYRVRNPAESWRTRLIDVAFTCRHHVRARGRTQLGGSAGLFGNGMAFSREVLRRVPYSAVSAVEDLEYATVLAANGIPVAFAETAWVAGDMPGSTQAARSQRLRWDLGRRAVRRAHGPQMIVDSIRLSDPLRADAAIELYLPPLGSIAALLAAVSALAAIPRFASPYASGALVLGRTGRSAHVIAGVARSTDPLKSLAALGRVPTYLCWKLALTSSQAWRSQRTSKVEWTRTERSSSLREAARLNGMAA